MGLFGTKEERAENLYHKGFRARLAHDEEKAHDYFLKAAGLGHAVSQWHCGQYADKKSWGGGIPMYEAAAQQGYLPAIESCIVYYMDENPSSSNMEKGRQWIKKLANMELPEDDECARRLRLYATPDGTCTLALEMAEDEERMQKDIKCCERVRRMLERAAGDGCTRAQLACGKMYREGLYGVKEPDLRKAWGWYRQAADKSGPARLAALWIGGLNSSLYSDPEINQWRKEQRERHKKAPDPAYAYYDMNYWDEAGSPERVPDDERLRCCLWAEKEGAVDEALRCARLYAAGRGAKADLAKAAGWYDTALKRGHKAALTELGDLCRVGGPGLARDLDRAVSLYQEAAQLAKPRKNPKDAPVADEETGARGLARQGEVYLLGEKQGKTPAGALGLYLEAARCFADFRAKAADEAEDQLKWGHTRAAAATLGLAFFEAELNREAFALLRFAGEEHPDPDMMLPLAGLYREGIPFLQKPDQQLAQSWFARWKDSLWPGKAVQLGSYPQEHGVPYSHGPAAFCTGFFRPLCWNVLKVEEERVLLLSERGTAYMSPQWSLGDVSDRETERIFRPGLRQMVEGRVFSLERAEFEEYLVKKKLAEAICSATMYARQCEATNHGLRTKREANGSLTVIHSSSKYWQENDPDGERSKDYWMDLLTTRESVWRLSDGAVDRAGKFTDDKWRDNNRVARPAVWIRLDGGEREDARTL